MSLEADTWNLARDTSHHARVDARQIIENCARLYNCRAEDIVGPIRFANFVEARHRAMFEVASQMPWMSFPQIGRIFGNRDHSSIMFAVQKHGLPPRKGKQFFSSRYDFLHKVRAVDTLFFGIGAAVHFEAVQCSKGEENEIA